VEWKIGGKVLIWKVGLGEGASRSSLGAVAWDPFEGAKRFRARPQPVLGNVSDGNFPQTLE